MFRLTRIMGVLALTTAFVVAPRFAFAQEDANRYVNRAGGYSIEFPQGWKIQEAPGGAAVMAIDPKAGTNAMQGGVSVVAEAVARGTSTDAYVGTALQNLKDAIPDLKVEQAAIKMGGEDAVCVTTSIQIQGKELRSIQYILVKGELAYVINCNIAGGDFAKQKAMLDKVAESFRIEGAQEEGAETATPEVVEAVTLEGENIYRDEAKNFSIQFPQDWKIETPAKGPVVKGVSPQTDVKNLAVVTVFARTASGETTALENRDRALERAQTSGAMTPIGIGATTIYSEGAAWFAYSTRVMLSETGKGIMYFLVKDERAFRIDCTCAPGAFEKYSPIFNAIASSFRFEAGAQTPAPAEETTAPAEGTPPVGFYEDEANGFSIVLPADWTVGGRGTIYAVTAVSARESETDAFSETVSVFIDSLGREPRLEAYEGRYVAGLRMKSPTFSLVESGPMKLGGKDGRFVVYSMRMGALKFRNVAYMFARGQSAYLVVGSALEDSYEKCKPIFEAAAASLKFKEQVPVKR